MISKKLFFILIMFCTLSIVAQNEKNQKGWRFSLGYNMTDSRVPSGVGGLLKDYFDGFNGWNSYALPTNITAELTLNERWGIQVGGSYAEIKKNFSYQEGQALLDEPFYAFDVKAKYDLNNLIGNTKRFDPYLSAGMGLSSIDYTSDFKINAGYGFYYWFNETWGLKWESSYYHNFKDTFPGYGGTATDFYQHNIGVVYQPQSATRSATWEDKR